MQKLPLLLIFRVVFNSIFCLDIPESQSEALRFKNDDNVADSKSLWQILREFIKHSIVPKAMQSTVKKDFKQTRKEFRPEDVDNIVGELGIVEVKLVPETTYENFKPHNMIREVANGEVFFSSKKIIDQEATAIVRDLYQNSHINSLILENKASNPLIVIMAAKSVKIIEAENPYPFLRPVGPQNAVVAGESSEQNNGGNDVGVFPFLKPVEVQGNDLIEEIPYQRIDGVNGEAFPFLVPASSQANINTGERSGIMISISGNSERNGVTGITTMTGNINVSNRPMTIRRNGVTNQQSNNFGTTADFVEPTSTKVGDDSSTIVSVFQGTIIRGINTTLVNIATQTNGTVTVVNFTETSSTLTPLPVATNLALKDVSYNVLEVAANTTSYIMGALIPLTVNGVPWLSGIQYLEAFRCQLGILNSNQSILPRSYVTYLIQNSDTSVPQAIGGAYSLEQQNTFMAVGPALNYQVGPIGYLYAPLNSSFISYSASAVDIGNSTSFPSFFRTIPSDNFQARAMAETMRLLEWSFVAALFTNDDYGSSGRQAFEVQAGRNRVQVTCDNNFTPGSTDNLQKFANCVASSDASVVLLWMGETDAANVLSFLYQNTTNSRLTFVASDRWALIRNPGTFNKTVPRTGLTFPLDFIEGTLGFFPQIGQLGQYQACASQINPSNTNYTGFNSVWEMQFRCTLQSDDTLSPCPETISERTIECRCTGNENFADLPVDPLVNYVQDSVLVMYQGLNSLISPADCEKLGYPSICNLEVFSTSDYVQALSLISVTGLTGPIQFNQTKPDRRRANFEIFQYNSTAIPSQVGFWNITGPFLGQNLLNFKTSPAIPISVLNPDTVVFGDGFWPTFVGVLSCIGIFISIVILAFFTIFAKSRVIRRTNLLWLYLLFVGIIMVFCALLLWVLESTTFTCTTSMILLVLGFGMVVAAIVIKVERIFRVLINSGKISTVLHTTELIIVVIVILIPDIIIIMVYWISSGSVPTPTVSRSMVDNTYLVVTCSPRGRGFSHIFEAIYLAYNGLVIIVCAVVLFMARNLQTAYSEGLFLFLVLIDLIILGAIMIPLCFTVGQQRGSLLQLFLLQSLSIAFAAFVTIALISYPKIQALVQHIKSKRRRHDEDTNLSGEAYYGQPLTTEESEDEEEFTDVSSASKPRFISQTYAHKSSSGTSGADANSTVVSPNSTNTGVSSTSRPTSSNFLRRSSASKSITTGTYTSQS